MYDICRLPGETYPKIIHAKHIHARPWLDAQADLFYATQSSHGKEACSTTRARETQRWDMSNEQHTFFKNNKFHDREYATPIGHIHYYDKGSTNPNGHIHSYDREIINQGGHVHTLTHPMPEAYHIPGI